MAGIESLLLLYPSGYCLAAGVKPSPSNNDYV